MCASSISFFIYILFSKLVTRQDNTGGSSRKQGGCEAGSGEGLGHQVAGMLSSNPLSTAKGPKQSGTKRWWPLVLKLDLRNYLSVFKVSNSKDSTL